MRELRLAEPDNEDWGLTILISRIEPTPDQMMRLLELAEDGAGGIAALVAGDTEAADGRMAPAVLQVAPDPQAPEGIIANVVPLQITVRPRTLSSGGLRTRSPRSSPLLADLEDVGQDADAVCRLRRAAVDSAGGRCSQRPCSGLALAQRRGRR